METCGITSQCQLSWSSPLSTHARREEPADQPCRLTARASFIHHVPQPVPEMNFTPVIRTFIESPFVRCRAETGSTFVPSTMPHQLPELVVNRASIRGTRSSHSPRCSRDTGQGRVCVSFLVDPVRRRKQREGVLLSSVWMTVKFQPERHVNGSCRCSSLESTSWVLYSVQGPRNIVAEFFRRSVVTSTVPVCLP